MQYVAFLKHVSMDDGFRSEEVRCSWGRYPMGVQTLRGRLLEGRGLYYPLLPSFTVLYLPIAGFLNGT